MKIIKLAADVAQKIAAGEVIERPASVVKELVENSLDAAADNIRIELTAGGKGSIRVMDNGSGMSRDDAALCFESHATSKVRTEEDLEHISTLGFRGEALASIAAVSRVTLTTASAGDNIGIRMIREGGELIQEAEIAFPMGTSLEIKDLFFNVPARKKFLRSERAELSRVVKYLTNAALAYPKVRFALIHGARKVFDYPGVNSLKERIFQVYGKTVLDKLLAVDHKDGELYLYGFASCPPTARMDRKYQLFFVNNRPVKDSTLQAALNQAYRGFLEKNQFAEAFLFLEIPAGKVDVNVHPTKAEIRFSDSRTIFKFIYRSLEQALLKEMGLKEVYPESHELPPGESEVKEEMQPPLMDQSSAFKTYGGKLFPFPEKQDVSGPQVLGQYQDLYIVAVDAEGLLIIDQHNAHERVLFDRFQELDASHPWPRKLALHPLLFELNPAQMISLEENLALLEAAGFSGDSMGGQTFALKEYPDIFQEAEAGEIFLALLDDVGREKIEQKKHRLLATIACKAAVKAGEPLSNERMEYLVEELFKSENAAMCPHGRPIIVRLSRSEIEKGLKR